MLLIESVVSDRRSGSMSLTSSSLLVVSNRLPFTLAPAPDGGLRRLPAAGGLVTAVAPVVIQVSTVKVQRQFAHCPVFNAFISPNLEPGCVGGLAWTREPRGHTRV